MNVRFCLAAAVVFGLSTMLNSTAQATPFTNGDFESGLLAPWIDFQGNATVVSGDYCCGLTGPGEGTFYLTLSSGGNTLSTLAQLFDTVAGKTYNYSFLYNRTGGGTDQLIVGFSDSATPTTLFNSQTLNLPASGGPYLSYSNQFTAAGASTYISFTNTQDNSGSDAAVDGVSITAVPEPSTLALGAVGVVGLLLAARRRHSR